MTAARVLIAGCGYVGSALGERLARDGHRVWGLRRDPAGLPQSIIPFEADLADAESLRRIPEALDYVFLTVGAPRFDDAAYAQAYAGSARNLLDALERQGQYPRRIFFTSSTGVYGQEDGSWVDEDSPTEPAGFAGKRLLEAERLLLEGPFPATILRLGGIYGPGRARLIESVRRGEAPLSSKSMQACPRDYVNLNHRDDCAGALRHLMNLETAAAVYLGVDCEPVPREEILRWIAARLGVTLREGEPAAPDGPHRPRGSKRCRNARLLATGYSFEYPTYREGFGAILDEEMK